jgi:hypothetical protein
MNSRVLLMLGAALLAATLVLGACSGDGSGSSDDSTEQSEKQERKERKKEGEERAQLACAALPVADIEAVYGPPVTQGGSADLGTCQWALGTIGQPGSAILLVSLAAPSPDAEQEFAELRATEGGEEIADLGDEALYTQAAILYVRTGDQTIAIQYFPLGSTPADPANPEPTPTVPPDQREQLTQLAQTILANLERPPASS